MTRTQLRRLFLDHRGESSRLARDLKVSPITISQWFRGHVESARIEAAVCFRAKELLTKESRKQVAERLHQELNKAYVATKLR